MIKDLLNAIFQSLKIKTYHNMEESANRYQGLKGRLSPNDLIGSSYTLSISGIILSGDEKPVFELLEAEPQGINPQILTLEASPTPTDGTTEHEITEFFKTYDENPSPLQVVIREDGKEFPIDVEIIHT